MEATIQYINIYTDGLIEMDVICNNCKHKNRHTITDASKKNGDKLIINFFKLGRRCCDNFGNPNSACYADYKSYL
jgi:thymidine kinase